MAKRKTTRTTELTVVSVVIRARGFDFKLVPSIEQRKPIIKAWRAAVGGPWLFGPLPPLSGKTLSDIYRTAAVPLFKLNVRLSQAPS